MAFTDTTSAIQDAVFAKAGTGTDATAEVQACIDGAVVLPQGVYRIDGQLTVGGGKFLMGSGPVVTTLDDHRAPDDNGTVVIPSQSFGYTLSGFSLVKNGAVSGTGIRMGHQSNGGQAGTQSGVAEVDGVWITGYSYGVHGGINSTDKACSEVTYTNLNLTLCDVGVYLEAGDTLDHNFFQFLCSETRIGIQTLGANNIHISGGSASGSVAHPTDVLFSMNHAHNFSVENFRAEACKRFFDHGTTLATQIMRFDTLLIAANPLGDPLEINLNWGASATIVNCQFDGYVKYNGSGGEPAGGYGHVGLDNCRTKWTSILQASQGGNNGYSLRNCGLCDSSFQLSNRLKNRSGRFGSRTTIPG